VVGSLSAHKSERKGRRRKKKKERKKRKSGRGNVDAIKLFSIAVSFSSAGGRKGRERKKK